LVDIPGLSSELDPIWRDFLKKIMETLPSNITPFLSKNLEIEVI